VHPSEVPLRRATDRLIFILNILWFVLGGFFAGLGWILAGVIMAITIIGLPWARAALTMAQYTLLPFGFRNISREKAGLPPTLGDGPLGLLGNIIWLVLAGWWLALGHVITAMLLAITIVGIPFAWAHLKLAGLALWPIGREIVPA